jgi:hypothetical protein
MRKVVFLMVVAVFASAGVASAETVRGVIADSMCAAKHTEEKGSDHSKCVTKCIQGGSSYVLVAKDKVLKIANQDHADLKAHAGHVVLMTGDVKDDTITVSKVEMPKADKEKK